jgi:manganese-dependent inorganic pyrophosphatase
MASTYVIGHVNPDTDSIAAAVGYAWLLRERDSEETVAARAGPINPQTTWVLKRLGMAAPLLLTDASPHFEAIAHRYDTTIPDKPLREAWVILNRTGGIAPVINPADGKPLGLITGLSLFNYLSKLVGLHPRQQEMRIAEILDLPCREACDIDTPRFQAGSRIRDLLSRVLREEHNEFLVVDDKGMYLGVCRQRDVLNPPRLRLILVDHNEPGQALGAVEEAELIEILDHHRLGNMPTHAPMSFSVDVVGSTSTLVSERMEDAGLSAPPEIAGLLLAGLLSDTLILTSPTTTGRDRSAADRLAKWAFVAGGPLEAEYGSTSEPIKSFGERVLQAGAGFSTRDPMEVVSTDLKLYQVGKYHFAIAQVEVTDLLPLDDHLEKLEKALKDLRMQHGLDFTMLMVTDVVGSSSRLVLVDAPPVLDDLPYLRKTDGTFLAEGVVSRKKQLLPVVLGLLEE